MRMARCLSVLGTALLAFSCVWSVQAAAAFADPAFQAQWQQGEAITTNFWGPLQSVGAGQPEPYQQAPSGQRLVQYFDKGRMELTNGAVTNGLLATEIIKGQIQSGDATFQAQAPPAIPIAGDPDNTGPTYQQLASTAMSLLAPTTSKTGSFVTTLVDGNGAVTDGGGFAGSAMTPALLADDPPTQHNVLGVFATYRTKVGLTTIGYAISEPFRANVKIASVRRDVLVQVFERRVLTYNASNSEAFKVEFGNIGAHYYRWRYGGSLAAAQSTTSALPPRSDKYHCVDFPSQAAAQAYLQAYPDDPSKLDANHDGIACAFNPPPFDKTPIAH